MGQPTAFGIAFAAHLGRRGWSQRVFAAMVDEHQSLIVRVASGERRPPLDRLERWLAALQPSGAEADELIRLALVAHGAGWLADRLEPAVSHAAEPGAVYGPGPPRRGS